MIKSVKILGMNYQIKMSKTLREEEKATGLCEPDLSLIQISTESSEQVQKATILHEVLEALCSHLNIEIKHHYIDLLEAGLFQVLQDNPKLVKYLSEK